MSLLRGVRGSRLPPAGDGGEDDAPLRLPGGGGNAGEQVCA